MSSITTNPIRRLARALVLTAGVLLVAARTGADAGQGGARSPARPRR